MEFFVSYIAPVLLGLFIGICSGLLGIGGGTILVPAFRLLFGMSPLESTATSMFTIIPTSISGAISHMRQKTVNVSLGLVLGCAGAVMSPIGVLLASISPPWLVMVAAALIIGYSAINMLWKAARMKSSGRREAKVEIPVVKTSPAGVAGVAMTGDAATGLSKEAVSPAPEREPLLPEDPQKTTNQTTNQTINQATNQKTVFTRKNILISVGVGLAAGLASGYVGVGGGFLMVPLMLAFLGVSMKQASGTSLIAIIILSIPGVISQALLGNVHYITGLIVAIGSIPGAIIGAHLLKLIPERTLRFIFGGFLIVAAVLLALNELHVLG